LAVGELLLAFQNPVTLGSVAFAPAVSESNAEAPQQLAVACVSRFVENDNVHQADGVPPPAKAGRASQAAKQTAKQVVEVLGSQLVPLGELITLRLVPGLLGIVSPVNFVLRP